MFSSIPQFMSSNRAAWYIGRFIRAHRDKMDMPIPLSHRLVSDIEANLVDDRQATYWQIRAIEQLHSHVVAQRDGDVIWHNLCAWIELRIEVVEPARDRGDRETILVALTPEDRDWLAPRRDCAVPYSQEDYESFSLAIDALQEIIRTSQLSREGRLVNA